MCNRSGHTHCLAHVRLVGLRLSCVWHHSGRNQIRGVRPLSCSAPDIRRRSMRAPVVGRLCGATFGSCSALQVLTLLLCRLGGVGSVRGGCVRDVYKKRTTNDVSMFRVSEHMHMGMQRCTPLPFSRQCLAFFSQDASCKRSPGLFASTAQCLRLPCCSDSLTPVHKSLLRCGKRRMNACILCFP